MSAPTFASRLPPGVEIRPRRMKFDFESSRKDWFDGEPVLTRFVEALSMLFPRVSFGILVSPGFFRHIVPQWLAYFRPGFHPRQHDNSDLIARWKARYESA